MNLPVLSVAGDFMCQRTQAEEGECHGWTQRTQRAVAVKYIPDDKMTVWARTTANGWVHGGTTFFKPCGITNICEN